MPTRALALAAIAFSQAGIALAQAPPTQDRPTFPPTRDVAVEYQTTGGPRGHPPHSLTTNFYFTTRGERLRADLPNQGYMIVDTVAKRLIMVMTGPKAYLEMPYDPGRMPTFAPPRDATFTRRGTDTVAGQTCTIWDVASKQGDGTACITADGVMLRGHGEGDRGGGSILALRVSYGAQPETLFQPPPDYRRLSIPR
jgi:hypothetical protein